MATNFQAVDSELDKIKSTLQGISSSLASSTPKQREQLSSAFKDLGGTLSSEQARRSVANAQASAPGTTPTSTSEIDPLTKALQEKAQSDARAKEAEAKKKEAEATTSIADQRALKNKTKTGTSSTAGVDGAPVEDKKMAFQELMQREPMLGDYGLTEENMADPMVIATLRNQVARSQQIEQDAARLQEMVSRKEARTQQQVALIGQSVANQTAQLKVEQRKRMAATGMAGLLTGRSLYSPEEHQGIIQEVVQEGILKLQEIQIEGYKLQNEMWDDFDNYEYEAYTKKSEMLKEYNKLELDTVTAVQTRLQQVAKQAQEKLVFDQQQMDRSSLILGEELVGASDDVIRQTALEQGIDYGLLKKAVADATFTKQDRDLSLTSKRLSIAASQKALSGGSGEGSRFTQAELAEIEEYAKELIKNPDTFSIDKVPSGPMRAAVIAKRNALQGEADAAKFLETGGKSFIDWVKEDKTRTKFVKSEFANKAGYSWMITPKGWDVERAIASEEGQNAVQIAIEGEVDSEGKVIRKPAKTNEEIYKAVFGTNGIIPEFIKEKAQEKEKKEGTAQKSANSTAAFAN